jgi:hypothetical protein
LGYLPWRADTPEDDYVSYNAMADMRKLREEKKSRGQGESEILNNEHQYFNNARKNIKVIHEVAEETDELKQARDWIRNCNRLYFLGFGYHPTNVERLQIKSIGNKDIMGTIYGLSNAQKDYVRNVIQSKNTLSFEKAFFGETVYRFLHDRVNLIIQ